MPLKYTSKSYETPMLGHALCNLPRKSCFDWHELWIHLEKSGEITEKLVTLRGNPARASGPSQAGEMESDPYNKPQNNEN